MNKRDTVAMLRERIKAKPEQPKSVIVSYTMPAELDKLVKEAAQRAGCSQAEVARAAFEEFFQIDREVLYQR